MTIYVFANNASSTLASGITDTDTTLTVASGEGSLFPTISAGQTAIITLEDVAGVKEIVYASARTGDVLTFVRAQEGTSAAAFASGSRVELRVTKGLLDALLQKNGGDVLAGTTTVTGVIDLGSGGSVQDGEFTGKLRSGAGVTAGQIYVSAGVPKSGTSTLLTNTNVATTLPAGYGLAEYKMVVMWSGASNAIPSGWALCDGTNGTPNLLDKFVLGGGGSFPTTGGDDSVTSGATTPTGTVGAHTLTTAEMPDHGHRLWTGGDILQFTSGGGTTYLVGSDTFNVGGAYATNTAAGSGGHVMVEHTGGGGSHTHTFTGGSHTHTVATLPPYRALFFIMKLATN